MGNYGIYLSCYGGKWEVNDRWGACGSRPTRVDHDRKDGFLTGRNWSQGEAVTCLEHGRFAEDSSNPFWNSQETRPGSEVSSRLPPRLEAQFGCSPGMFFSLN